MDDFRGARRGGGPVSLGLLWALSAPETPTTKFAHVPVTTVGIELLEVSGA